MSDDADDDPADRYDNGFDEPDFDEPIADPAIRAHNEVDFWMTGILSKAVRMLAPDGGLANLALGDFATRATNLQLLMHTAPHLALGNVGDGRLHDRNGTRNVLAHSHFDQDPWDGTFEIVKARHRTLTEKRLNNLNAESINRGAEELERIASHMSAVFDFIGHPVPSEYLTQWPIMLKSRELWEMMIEEAAKEKTSDAPATPEQS